MALVDGSAPTLEEMARRAEAGEMFWGYSIGPLGRMLVATTDVGICSIAFGRDDAELVAGLRALPDQVRTVLDREKEIAAMSHRYSDM